MERCTKDTWHDARHDDRMILYYPVSKYIITIEGLEYEYTADRFPGDTGYNPCGNCGRNNSFSSRMVNMYRCIKGLVTEIYDITEGTVQDMTFPESNDDKTLIVRKGDLIHDVRICFDSFRLAISDAILERNIKSNFTGLAITYCPGYLKKKLECEFKDGVRDGIYASYIFNGYGESKVSVTGSYCDGKKHGLWTDYGSQRKDTITTYRNGQIRMIRGKTLGIEFFLDKTVFHIFWTRLRGGIWDKTITVYKDEMDQKEYVSKLADVQNKINSKGGYVSYEDMIKQMFRVCYVKLYNGIYDMKNERIAHEEYKLVNRRNDGEYIERYGNGNMKLKRQYDNGRAVGKIERWHDNEVLAETGYYWGEELEGEYETWNPDGSRKCTKEYQSGYLMNKIFH